MKTRKQIIIPALVIVAIFAFIISVSISNGQLIPPPLEIKVDAAKTLEEMPEVLFAGMEISQWGNKFKIDYYRKKYFGDNAVKLHRLGLNLNWHVSSPSESRDDYMRRLKLLDPIILDYYTKSGEFIFTIYGMPKWLSSRCQDVDHCSNGWEMAPPQDYNEWARLVRDIVNHYNKELGLSLMYEVWNEPDQYYVFNNDDFWVGTESEYFKLYEYAVNGARNADPNVKIGGPASSVWNHNVIYNFIKYCREHNLPISFISWHSYIGWNNFYGSVSEYKQMTGSIKGWLQSHGYDPQMPLIMDEWNYNPNFGKVLEHDTEFTSSYIVYALNNMVNGGVDKQTFFHLVDFGDQGCFSGNLGLMCADGIIKSVWNSFKALSILNGKKEGQIPNRLQASFNEDDFVTVLASQTKDGKTNRVLLSNFIPSAGMIRPFFLQTLKSCMLTKYTEDEYKGIIMALRQTAKANPPQNGVTLEYVRKIAQLTDFPDPFNDQKVKQDLNACLAPVVAKAKEIQYYAKNPRDVKLTFSNLGAGTYTVSMYTIDKDHANSCRYNKKTESTPTNTECGVNGEIDKKVQAAKQEAQAKAKQAAFAYLKLKGYTDRDIRLMVEMAKRCEMKVQCITEAIDEHYLKLDRCKSNQCQSSEIVKAEIKEAIEIFRETRDRLFYEAIDKINNLPQVSLDGSKQTKQITVSKDGSYSGTITMQPYSVILTEIIKR